MNKINILCLSILIFAGTVNAQEKKEQKRDSLKVLKEVIINTNWSSPLIIGL
jgi:iron complex outermembrane receptor protein